MSGPRDGEAEAAADDGLTQNPRGRRPSMSRSARRGSKSLSTSRSSPRRGTGYIDAALHAWAKRSNPYERCERKRLSRSCPPSWRKPHSQTALGLATRRELQSKRGPSAGATTSRRRLCKAREATRARSFAFRPPMLKHSSPRPLANCPRSAPPHRPIFAI